jgi:histidyl-tRNA synthetase
MAVSTHPPSGFRDFIKDEARRRFELMEKISFVYRSFGFEAIETPAFENLDVLLGSGGGDENEKLIFKVLKRGDKLKDALASSPSEDSIADFGLRFDLTVPLSRLVAQHRGEIHLPWKVFHIGPVWRAERSQKGRFREFVQCDVDIVGAKTFAAELEVIQAVVSAISSVGGEGFELRINDRRLLQAFADKHAMSDAEFHQFAIILDKKDKVDPSTLRDEARELLGSKFNSQVEALLRGDLGLDSFESIHSIASAELQRMVRTLKEVELPVSAIQFDSSLVRGIGYYTGPVFELRHASAGYSFGGGGRYDRLIGRFMKESLPACGFSIGFERLALLLKEQEKLKSSSTVFIPVFHESLRVEVLRIATELRQNGIAVDVYADEAKLKTQFKYASDMNRRWVVICGEDELAQKRLKLKDFESGQEEDIARQDLIAALKIKLKAS